MGTIFVCSTIANAIGNAIIVYVTYCLDYTTWKFYLKKQQQQKKQLSIVQNMFLFWQLIGLWGL